MRTFSRAAGLKLLVVILSTMLFVAGCASTSKHTDDPGAKSGQQQSSGHQRTVTP